MGEIEYRKCFILNESGRSYSDTNALPTKQQNNYYEDVLLDKISGIKNILVAAFNPDVEPGTEETIWNQGGQYPYLPSNTNLYISSTSDSDNQVWLLNGLDSEFNRIFGIATLNGKNQVLLSEQFFRIYGSFNLGSTDNIGDIYIAESDTLTDGVPNTPAKIQMKIRAGDNTGTNAIYTVRKGKTATFSQIEGSIGKGKDAQLVIKARPPGGIFVKVVLPPIYQLDFNFFQKTGFSLGEGSDLEIAATTNDATTPVSIFFTVIEVENEL